VKNLYSRVGVELGFRLVSHVGVGFTIGMMNASQDHFKRDTGEEAVATMAGWDFGFLLFVQF